MPLKKTPDPLTCIRHLKSLVGHGLSLEHDSTGDLGALIQSALVGVRKEVDQRMEYLETEHVEHKTNPQHQRKMVRFWKCTDISLHASKAYTTGDTEQNFDQVYYQWTKMQKPSRLVDTENLAFSRRVAFGCNESRVFPSDP